MLKIKLGLLFMSLLFTNLAICHGKNKRSNDTGKLHHFWFETGKASTVRAKQRNQVRRASKKLHNIQDQVDLTCGLSKQTLATLMATGMVLSGLYLRWSVNEISLKK